MFTLNSSKQAQSYCKPAKRSRCDKLQLHMKNENHFHQPHILKLAFGTHKRWILNWYEKHKEIYQNISKKLLQV